MGRAMISKSLIQFSVDGWGCVPSLLFNMRPNCGGGNEDNGILLQKVPCMYCHTQCSQPCNRPPSTHTSARAPRHSQASLGQSLVGSLLLSPGSWCTQGFVPSKSLCNFWQLYGAVNGDLLQEDLCHTQAYCMQSPSPCSRPLLTHPSAGDTQTPF